MNNDNEKIIRAVDFKNKESLVDLLFRVQGGFISCRLAASILIAIHEGTEPCEGCCNPATTSDSEGVPLCDECVKAL